MAGSFGLGVGHAGFLIRFKPATEAAPALRNWLLQDILPRLPSRPGIGSVHLFEGALTPGMTTEQRLRGADAGVDWALLVTGYSHEVLASLGHADLGNAQLEKHGATGIVGALYRMDYSVIRRELDA